MRTTATTVSIHPYRNVEYHIVPADDRVVVTFGAGTNAEADLFLHRAELNHLIEVLSDASAELYLAAEQAQPALTASAGVTP